MYRKFFGLAEDPFNLTPDSRFLYLSKKHREALASLLYGIHQRKGFITLTGEIGSGKTTLCRALLNELDEENIDVALIFNSYLTEIELLQTINEDFGIPSESESKRDLIKELNKFLLQQNSTGHNVVLIIDEAQNLSIEVLEQIRMLSNLETETEKLIQIVLMGQPELLDKLALPELEQLNQRISVRYHIQPLDKDDVAYYIRHRLFVARAQVEIEFTPAAINMIYEFSGGVPRKINVLCDRCLLAAYSKVTYTIDAGIVKEAITEIEGEKRSKKQVESAKKTQPAGYTPRMFLWLIILIPLLGIVIAGGVILGAYLSRPAFNPGEVAVTKLPSETSPPAYLNPPDLNENNNQPLNPDSENREGITPTPTPEQKKQKPKPRRYYYNWQWDKYNICRVDNPAFAYPAAIITWLRIWNYEVELDPFRDLDMQTVLNLDLSENETLGLKKFIVDEWGEAVKYDLPFIIRFSDSPEGLSPAVVILRLEGISCTIADPLSGLRTIRKAPVKENVSHCVMLYFDKHNFSRITPEEDSERVAILQDFLKSHDFYTGEINGIFDSATIRAVKRFQGYHEIEQTGTLNEETVMLITSRMVRMRPRLFTSGGEELPGT